MSNQQSESNPARLGGKHERFLCAILPPSFLYFSEAKKQPKPPNVRNVDLLFEKCLKWGQVQLDWLTGLSRLTLEMFSQVFLHISYSDCMFHRIHLFQVRTVSFSHVESKIYLCMRQHQVYLFSQRERVKQIYSLFCVLIVVQVLTKWVILFSCYVLWFSFFKRFHFPPQML